MLFDLQSWGRATRCLFEASQGLFQQPLPIGAQVANAPQSSCIAAEKDAS
jgi:hypothetical protein